MIFFIFRFLYSKNGTEEYLFNFTQNIFLFITHFQTFFKEFLVVMDKKWQFILFCSVEFKFYTCLWPWAYVTNKLEYATIRAHTCIPILPILSNIWIINCHDIGSKSLHVFYWSLNIRSICKFVCKQFVDVSPFLGIMATIIFFKLILFASQWSCAVS